MKISASVVLYKTDEQDIRTLCADILASGLDIAIFLVDNSPEPCIDSGDYPQASYILSGGNLGYGSGHNIAIRKAMEAGSDYHFVLNPDVHFGPTTLKSLVDFAETNPEIGCVMPKILNVDGSVQRLCRLLPTPLDLIGRRFLHGLIPAYIDGRNRRYELAFWDYDSVEEVPILSGSFMLLRTSTLALVGAFDERFFMYLEDYDLVRRIGEKAKTVYFPKAEATHAHAKMSYKSLKPTLWHIRSAITYFCKWGWFFDAKRYSVNAAAVSRVTRKQLTGESVVSDED